MHGCSWTAGSLQHVSGNCWRTAGQLLLSQTGQPKPLIFPYPVFTEEELQKERELPVPVRGQMIWAYLVYTSGSTGKPKAVEVEQHSVLNLAAAMTPLYPKGAVLSICNVGFDAFFAGEHQRAAQRQDYCDG